MSAFTIGQRVEWQNATLGWVPATVLDIGIRVKIQPDHRPSPCWVGVDHLRPRLIARGDLPEMTEARRTIFRNCADALDEGRRADIWYDAHDYGDTAKAEQIEDTQNAMEQAAALLRSFSDPITPEGR
jgi:hypothetical protein